MKNYIVFVFIICVSFIAFCSPAKKATVAVKEPTIFYDTNVKSLVELRCSPCHIPAKGGKKEALDTYESVKGHIDEIISRIELNPGDKGFMPFKHPKLSDAEINIFKTWKAEGMVKM